MDKVYTLKNFIQIHRKQQKEGFYLFVVVEVTSFQINIIHKQQKCCQYICFDIAFINFIQNDTKISCTQLVKFSNNCHIHTHRKKN